MQIQSDSLPLAADLRGYISSNLKVEIIIQNDGQPVFGIFCDTLRCFNHYYVAICRTKLRGSEEYQRGFA